MTCIGGRRPVRILRGDCIIIGYADTGTTNEGVSLLLFSHSLFDFPLPHLNKAATTAQSRAGVGPCSAVQDQLRRADSLETTAALGR